MDGEEIFSLIQKDLVLKTQFLNVYAADELPKYMPVGKGLIVNCYKKGLPGLHWLALYQSAPDKVEFFDSFGRQPCFYGLQIKTGKLDRWNRIQLQNLFSDVCGLYCILYLLERVRGKHIDTIVNMFSHHNTIFNDNLVRKKICKHFDFLK